MAGHNDVGKIGEDLAREHLQKLGYKILEQNWRTKYSEIDLVCQAPPGFWGEKLKTLVFVEVRTKVGQNFGSPEDTLDRKKLAKVLYNAKAYAAIKKWPGPCRIDAVCIVLKQDFSVERLAHHENIAA